MAAAVAGEQFGLKLFKVLVRYAAVGQNNKLAESANRM